MKSKTGMSESSLEEFLPGLKARKVVIAGAGPSLDYCRHEIKENIAADSLFFLTDIIAANFIRLYPKARRIIFTVECRLHAYLKSLQNEEIAFYTGASRANLPVSIKDLYLFHFDFDEKDSGFLSGVSTRLVSPGTVSGAALAAALYLAKKGRRLTEIDLLGVDFSYPEERIYSRMAYRPGEESPYFNRRENREYHSMVARGSRLWLKQGFGIVTSEEFFRAKKNFETLLLSIPGSALDSLLINDFSPLGLSAGVCKKIPHLLK